MRYFIDIAFHGKQYHGWQIQPNVSSVQGILEEIFSTYLRRDIKVIGAGRTDAGVHARQMIAHFDTTEEIQDVEETIFRLNSFLPEHIALVDMYRVKDDAHARFDAIEREYQYGIVMSKDPFRFEIAHQLHNEVDIDAMNEAAQLLLGHQDFQCFSRSHTDVKTYYCDVRKAVWEYDDYFLIFTIVADRFLRNMVRAIVGTLLDVGFHKINTAEFKAIIQSKDRSKAGASAPAHGLFLTRVSYPEEVRL